MKALNGLYRGKHYATDVLSFDAPPVFRKMGVLGELILCWPTLRSQAREQKHSEAAELRVLLVHGLLHLLGFDHEKGPRAARQMQLQEAALLKRLRVSSKGEAKRGLIARSRSGKR
jgi:probable rRNA maturation factor